MEIEFSLVSCPRETEINKSSVTLIIAAETVCLVTLIAMQCQYMNKISIIYYCFLNGKRGLEDN